MRSALRRHLAKFLGSLGEIGISIASTLRNLIELDSLSIRARHKEAIPATKLTLGAKVVQIIHVQRNILHAFRGFRKFIEKFFRVDIACKIE